MAYEEISEKQLEEKISKIFDEKMVIFFANFEERLRGIEKDFKSNLEKDLKEVVQKTNTTKKKADKFYFWSYMWIILSVICAVWLVQNI